jgi:Leucine-rich repeat (LRR) protein
VSDLSPLKGMPIETLSIAATQVSDLTPLRGMPLEILFLDLSQVADLTPIKGMGLRVLGLGFTKATDLQAVAGMQLAGLSILGTKITDLTPLKGMDLEMLAFEPWKVEKGIDIVRGMPKLRIISVGQGYEYTYLNPADFWKRYDEGRFKSGKQKWKSEEELMEWMIKVFESRERNQ